MNENINKTKISTKIKFENNYYYVLIENYIIYKNEKLYVKTKQKIFKTKIKHKSSKKILCYKSKNEKYQKITKKQNVFYTK